MLPETSMVGNQVSREYSHTHVILDKEEGGPPLRSLTRPSKIQNIHDLIYLLCIYDAGLQ